MAAAKGGGQGRRDRQDHVVADGGVVPAGSDVMEFRYG